MKDGLSHFCADRYRSNIKYLDDLFHTSSQFWKWSFIRNDTFSAARGSRDVPNPKSSNVLTAITDYLNKTYQHRQCHEKEGK